MNSLTGKNKKLAAATIIVALSAIAVFSIVLAQEQELNIYASTLYTEGDPFITDLIAGKHIDAGDIEVWNDVDNLYLRIVTDENWQIVETHVMVAEALEDIPQRNGNPPPGQFAYKEGHDLVEEYTYTIPLEWPAGTELFVAVHAEVEGTGEGDHCGEEESAWGQGGDFPGRNWAMYFNYVVSEVLVDTVQVNAISDITVESSITLASGVQYRLVATGVANAGDFIDFDAKYSKKTDIVDDWTDIVTGYESYGTILLDLLVDGGQVDWGAYNEFHTYSIVVTGEDATVSLLINDIYYENNAGFLTVEIYWVGT